MGGSEGSGIQWDILKLLIFVMDILYLMCVVLI